VADFGISKKRKERRSHDEVDPHSGEQHTMGVGTPRYAAPEIFAVPDLRTSSSRDVVSTHTGYDERVDVYSFGLLLWEMSHNQIAFDGVPGFAVAMKAREGSRPVIALAGANGMEGLAELIEACWHHEPSARLSMPACAEQLTIMLRGLEAPSTSSTNDASLSDALLGASH
jgi:serine/threonine protein kinase